MYIPMSNLSNTLGYYGQQQVCPTCGYCPTCGRKHETNQFQQPYVSPYQYPIAGGTLSTADGGGIAQAPQSGVVALN